MTAWLEGLGLAAAVLSAAALYAGSAQCRWPRLGGRRRGMRLAGLALGLLAAAAGNRALGAAGLCAVLACWMLALVAQPWLALLFCKPPPAGEAPRAHRRQADSRMDPATMRKAG